MKLDIPLSTAERARVSAALQSLDSATAAWSKVKKTLNGIEAERTALETEHQGLQSGGDTSAETAARLVVIERQHGLMKGKLQQASQDVQSAGKERRHALTNAAEIKLRYCKPLFEQFKADLAAALRPFVKEPAYGVQAIVNLPSSSGYIELTNFIKRGQHIPADIGTYELMTHDMELSATLRAMLDGKDIWSLLPVEETAEAAA